MMEKRVALLGIIIENSESAEALNQLLHEYKDYIVGRMGIPYRQRGINIISIVIDASADTINSLTGKIGMLSGVNAKAIYSKLTEGNNG